MKTPIEVKDIRKGDLIRWESGELAHEFRTSVDQHGWDLSLGQHYLLDRPTAPVELPTEPTLGWVTIRDGETLPPQFGRWHAEREMGMLEDDDPRHFWRIDAVTAFTPAVAVPKSALDRLRKAENVVRGVNAFLAAIDEANGDRP